MYYYVQQMELFQGSDILDAGFYVDHTKVNNVIPLITAVYENKPSFVQLQLQHHPYPYKEDISLT